MKREKKQIVPMKDGIEVRVQDKDVWLTQKAIAQLFDVDRSVVTKQLGQYSDAVMQRLKPLNDFR